MDRSDRFGGRSFGPPAASAFTSDVARTRYTHGRRLPPGDRGLEGWSTLHREVFGASISMTSTEPTLTRGSRGRTSLIPSASIHGSRETPTTSGGPCSHSPTSWGPAERRTSGCSLL